MTNTNPDLVPWSVGGDLTMVGSIYAGSTMVAQADDEATAALIVERVNVITELAAALRAFVAQYDGWDDFQLERRTDRPTFRAVKQAKLVLAKASRC